MKPPSLRHLTQAAVIAALYTALTLLLKPFSYGVVQVRVSEALTILPLFTPAAPAGLFVGCLLANLLGGATPLDIVFGPLATLAAALLTCRFREHLPPALAAPVLVNAIVVGLVLHFGYGEPLWLSMGSVFLGQAVACVGLGLPLRLALRRLPAHYLQ